MGWMERCGDGGGCTGRGGCGRAGGCGWPRWTAASLVSQQQPHWTEQHQLHLHTGTQPHMEWPVTSVPSQQWGRCPGAGRGPGACGTRTSTGYSSSRVSDHSSQTTNFHSGFRSVQQKLCSVYCVWIEWGRGDFIVHLCALHCFLGAVVNVHGYKLEWERISSLFVCGSGRLFAKAIFHLPIDCIATNIFIWFGQYGIGPLFNFKQTSTF